MSLRVQVDITPEGLRHLHRRPDSVIYDIDDNRLVVTVHRVQHRRDGYRPR